MADSADPLDGWDLGYLLQSSYSSAINDIYGNLFYHLRDLLSSFIRQVASRKIAFELFNMDVNDLPRHLGGRQFARIEVISEIMCWKYSADRCLQVSNISDGGYLGIARTLSLLSPFLQKRTENSYATMITLFMNAVAEMVHFGPPNRAEAVSLLRKVAEYLSATRPPRSEYDPEAIQRVAAHDLVRDNDKYFNQSVSKFPNIEAD